MLPFCICGDGGSAPRERKRKWCTSLRFKRKPDELNEKYILSLNRVTNETAYTSTDVGECEVGCARLTDGRARIHPAGVSFRPLLCERRSTRNRRSSLLRFEADENLSPSGAKCATYLLVIIRINQIYFIKRAQNTPYIYRLLCGQINQI